MTPTEQAQRRLAYAEAQREKHWEGLSERGRAFVLRVIKVLREEAEDA